MNNIGGWCWHVLRRIPVIPIFFGDPFKIKDVNNKSNSSLKLSVSEEDDVQPWKHSDLIKKGQKRHKWINE